MKLKTIDEYYEQMYKEFPSVPPEDIRRILQYGFKSFYLHNSYGGDIFFQDPHSWFYCGRLVRNSVRQFKYYCKKLMIKLRVLYKRRRSGWNGYYYFGLEKWKYDEYKAAHNKPGRPIQWYTFKNVMLRKIEEECTVMDTGAVAIFRVPILADLGMYKFYSELRTKDAELVKEKEPTTFSQLIKESKDYDLIKNRKNKLR